MKMSIYLGTTIQRTKCCGIEEKIKTGIEIENDLGIGIETRIVIGIERGIENGKGIVIGTGIGKGTEIVTGTVTVIEIEIEAEIETETVIVGREIEKEGVKGIEIGMKGVGEKTETGRNIGSCRSKRSGIAAGGEEIDHWKVLPVKEVLRDLCVIDLRKDHRVIGSWMDCLVIGR